MLGIWVPIRLEQYLFGQIRIRERAIAVPSLIFQPRSPIGIQVIPRFENSDFISTELLSYSTDCTVGEVDFHHRYR
jgi:hypothetical protein